MSSAALNVIPCRFSEIYLHTESESYDLHNSFKFAGFSYDALHRTVTLRWLPDEHVLPEQRHPLAIEMRGVTHFSATSRDPGMPFSEDTCLSSVGGVRSSDPTLDVSSDIPHGWHHVFTFQSGFVLRIGAESVVSLPENI